MKIKDYVKLPSMGISKTAQLNSYLDNYKGVRVVRVDNTSTSELLQLRVYFLVKSKSDDKIEYCVTFDLTTDKSAVDKNTEFLTISNEPNFQFRYAFVYNKNKLMIRDLKEIFLNKLAYTKRPKVTNPHELLVMNEKIFHCIHYMSKNKIKFNKKVNNFGQTFKPMSADQMTQISNSSNK